MAISSTLSKRLIQAVTSTTLGNELATAINAGSAYASQSRYVLATLIVATNVSQTQDFAAVRAGDFVVMIPATAGSADFISPGTNGNLGQAAVVGNLYMVMRPFVPDATSAEIL